MVEVSTEGRSIDVCCSDMTLPRSRTPEWMDDPELPEPDHLRALAGLARLNRLSGVSWAIYQQLAKYAKRIGGRPLRVLDVASGSGDLAIDWAARAARSGLRMRITATDVSGVAIEAIEKGAESRGLDIVGLRRDCVREGLPTGFDVVTCSLFFHHLEDAQAIRLLQSMRASADVAVVICDLERSWLNLALVTLASRLVTRSSVVHHDAVASVRGAYTRYEFERLAERALTHPIEVRPLFPCRFLASIDASGIPIATVAFA